MCISTSVRVALRPCGSIEIDVPSGSNSSDVSSETSDNLDFVSKEGKSSVWAYFGCETNAQQATERENAYYCKLLSVVNLSIDCTVIKSNILTQFFLCKHLDQMPSNTKYNSELVITYPKQNTSVV